MSGTLSDEDVLVIIKNLPKVVHLGFSINRIPTAMILEIKQWFRGQQRTPLYLHY